MMSLPLLSEPSSVPSLSVPSLSEAGLPGLDEADVAQPSLSVVSPHGASTTWGVGGLAASAVRAARAMSAT